MSGSAGPRLSPLRDEFWSGGRRAPRVDCPLMKPVVERAAMSATPEYLNIQVVSANGVSVMTVAGEVGFANSPTLLRSANTIIEQRPVRTIIDLSAVTYMDSSGVGTLVQIKRLIEQAGGVLVLAGMQARVRGVFEITNLQSFFRIAADVNEARTK